MKLLGRDAPAIPVEIITDVPGRDRLQVENGERLPQRLHPCSVTTEWKRDQVTLDRGPAFKRVK
jgi:hypothetical protein